MSRKLRTEQEQLRAVEQYSLAVADIENPSKAVQIAAVQKCPYHICHIKNPVGEVQVLAMMDDVRNIQYLKSLSEDAVRALMNIKFDVFMSGHELNPDVMKKVPEGLRREISNMVVVRDVHHR